MPPKSPLLGYNNNIPHKGKMYHVQTEDSGTRRPHVITHLFADGGRIVHTTKTSYAELVEDPGVIDKVRQLMKDQHRAMVDSLRKGELEHLIDQAPARNSKPPARVSKPPPRSSVPPASKPPRASKPPSNPQPGPPSRRSRHPQPISDQPPPVQEAGSGYRFIGQARKKTNPEMEVPKGLVTPDENLPSTKRRGSADIPAAPGVPQIERGVFGQRFLSERPLDQVMLAFLYKKR